MPKMVPCPVCQADVKVPRDAEPGDEVTCPECDEAFIPKHLRKKGYDPKQAAGYDVEDRDDDDEETHETREKRRKTKAIRAAGRELRRDERKSGARPFFGGIEVALILIALAVSSAGLLGFVVAKRFPTTGEG